MSIDRRTIPCPLQKKATVLLACCNGRSDLFANRQQAQAVQDDNQRAPFVSEHADGERNCAKQCEGYQGDDHAEGDRQVLPDDSAGTEAQLVRGKKIFEFVVHQDHFSLFEGGVAAACSHRDANVSGGDAGGIVYAVTDHGNFFAALGEAVDNGELVVRLELGADVVEGQVAGQLIGGGLAVAGEDKRLQATIFERGNQCPGFRADVIAEQQPAAEFAGV